MTANLDDLTGRRLSRAICDSVDIPADVRVEHLDRLAGMDLAEAICLARDIPQAARAARLRALDRNELAYAVCCAIDIQFDLRARHLDRLVGDDLRSAICCAREIPIDIRAAHLCRLDDGRRRAELLRRHIDRIRDIPDGSLCKHMHHEMLYERLEFPAVVRALYIVVDKSLHELDTRLRLFSAATQEEADAYDSGNTAQLLRLHAIHCPDCPWDGETIFPAQPTRFVGGVAKRES